MRFFQLIFVGLISVLNISMHAQHMHEKTGHKRNNESIIPRDSSKPKGDAPVTLKKQGAASSMPNASPQSTMPATSAAVSPAPQTTNAVTPNMAHQQGQVSSESSAITSAAEIPTPNVQTLPTPDASIPPQVSAPTQTTPTPPASQPAQKSVAAQEDKKVAPPEEEVKGIDSIDVEDPRGNWLLKRQWFQRSQARYEKIKALVQNISEMRMEFFKKRSELDRKVLDPFYLEYGLGRGLLEELIANLMTRIQDEQTRQGALSEEERLLLIALETEKNTLEQLQKDIHTINEIDLRIDDLTSMLIQQIGKARGYENQAWQHLKKIADELSDKKAYEHFYMMGTLWENANDISEFIQGPYLQSFDQFIKLANEQVEKVKGTIKALKEKGIDFKRQLLSIEEKSQQEKDTERLEQERQAEEEALIRKKKEEEKNRGYFTRIGLSTLKFVSSVYDYFKAGVVGVWNMTLGRFFSGSKHEQSKEASTDDKTAFALPSLPVPRDERSLLAGPILKEREEKENI